MPEPAFRDATAPLFEQGLVDCVEWTPDIGWGLGRIPYWTEAVLDAFSGAGRLYAHGFGYSVLSGRWERRQAEWLERLRADCRARRFARVTEHYCFMTAGDFRASAALPPPRTAGTLAVGVDRLRRLADAAELPVGLENLALAMSREDALGQGPFLAELLEAVDGFLILDLHNLWCAAHNFGLSPLALLASYPLHRVRQLHVSGGSWWTPAHTAVEGPFRRDTHDGPVPDPVVALLPAAIAACPALDSVILERLGDTLLAEAPGAPPAAPGAVGPAGLALVAEFRALRALVAGDTAHG